jgi:hypothetical protein
MAILGIFSNCSSAEVNSWGTLNNIYQDKDVLILSDQNPQVIDSGPHTYEAIFGYFFNPTKTQSNPKLDETEGNFIKISVDKEGDLNLTTDIYCRTDLYYVNTDNLKAFSTNLDFLLEMLNYDVDIDQFSLAHSLSIYGNRSPKKSTLYSQIKRLGYRETLKFKKSILSVSSALPNLPKMNNEIDKITFLENYSDAFLSALDKRSSVDQNIVFLSSGWDSSAIVAGLERLVGKDKITCVIGEMLYSKRAGTINNFEMERAKKICDYYGIELKTVKLDYSDSLPKNFPEIKEFLKSNQIASIAAVNHFLLTEAVKELGYDDGRIFAGEMSDGAHNLGFSQFVSIFHPNSLDFREYSDKMRSYLFGPSFLEFANQDTLEKDPVWTYIRDSSEIKFEKTCDHIYDRTNQFLTSFFLRNNRIPFSSRANLKFLTASGAKRYEEKFAAEYFSPLEEYFSSPYIYSLYIHLYNSFHWQGSTVNSIEIVGDYFDIKSSNPFHDEELLNLLKSMPESYGRGLDLNPTKYPLKWTLEHRLNYPMKLNAGFHSYAYDINPQFNHSEEIMFHSAFRGIFQQLLKDEKLLQILDKEFFDIEYINQLSNRYVNLQKISSNELSDLFAICTNSLII